MAGRTLHSVVAACCMTLTGGSGRAQQNVAEEVLQTTRAWLKSASEANRTGLNAIMDSRGMMMTPAGEVQAKERLVPDDPAQPVQSLPPFDLDSPIVRLYGDTAVLMSRLKATGGTMPALNATFVYTRRDNAWRLVALHLSPR